jgi:predicted glycosyltransferase
MFYDLIRDLEADGHTIIITSRPLANTVELLDQRGLKHTVVGEHYGKDFFKKIFGYPIRVLQLRKFLKKQKPDLAVSQSSFHSPVVAKLLGIPSIYTNDNEHALGNKPAFFAATKILIPENLPVERVAKTGISAKKVIQYPGVKEGIYLWSKGEAIQEKRKANINGR